MSRTWIVEDFGPDALERFQSPLVDPLLDHANFWVRERPGAHRHLQVGPVEAVSAGYGGCQAGECCLRIIGCRVLDCLVERFDDKSLVRSKEGLFEVARAGKVMVKRAFANSEAPAESIDAEAFRAVVGNGCKASLNPIGSGRHGPDRTIRYGMET